MTRGGATRELQATPDASRPGRFTAPVPADQPGLLRVDVDARRDGAPVGEAHEWTLVGGVDREWADPRRNDGVLDRLARGTGGRLVAENEIRSCRRWSPPRTRPPRPPRRPRRASSGIRRGCCWGCSRPSAESGSCGAGGGYDRSMRSAFVARRRVRRRSPPRPPSRRSATPSSSPARPAAPSTPPSTARGATSWPRPCAAR